MKPLKLFLITVSILMFVALCLVGFVWLQLQSLSKIEHDDTHNMEADDAFTSEYERVVGTDGQLESAGEPHASETDRSESSPAPTLNVDVLSADQQETLNSLGIDASSIEITQDTIDCSKQALGEARYNEVLDGANPGPLEALKLLGCIKQ